METIELPFNPARPATMLIDINSCFASIEQQANPLLRGRPMVVAAYKTASGCILAASREAKVLGIKTGMRVREGRVICPELVVLEPDPAKYRHVHQKLKQLIGDYTSDLVAKSIDEFSLNFDKYPGLNRGLMVVGKEIKERIRKEIGDWLTVSIGIGPNIFLAKMASNLKKPDGLEEINIDNVESIYKRWQLTDLWGIKQANAGRLNLAGIYTVEQMYRANIGQLRSAFHSIGGYYWYLRLRGWEIDGIAWQRKSFGAMYSIPSRTETLADLAPILHKLVEKVVIRLRHGGWQASGVHLAEVYKNRSFWHRGKMLPRKIDERGEIYRQMWRMLGKSPTPVMVGNLAVTVYGLSKITCRQMDLFGEIERAERIAKAADRIRKRWGKFVLMPAMMLSASDKVVDRIGFGNVGDIG